MAVSLTAAIKEWDKVLHDRVHITDRIAARAFLAEVVRIASLEDYDQPVVIHRQ
jgi:hypothetical protein